MAEEKNTDRSTDDLSDEASPYRLEEYRKKGQVAQSRELVALVLFITSGAVIAAMGPSIGKQLAEYMKDVFANGLPVKEGIATSAWFGEKLHHAFKVTAMIGLPISIAGFVLGVASHLAQIGFIFSTEPISFNLEKINPVSGLGRLFSMQHFWDSLRVVFKGIVLSFVAYILIKSEVFRSPEMVFERPQGVIDVLSSSSKVIFFTLSGVLVLFAAVDFFLQRREYGKQVRVTRQEAKQESKEQEGDPLVKARIRSIQREVARKRMMNAVKKADVVITNPTHLAIALIYDRDKMVAPKVVAKGADFVAQKIKKIAAEAGVPLVENVPLARAIYKSVKLNQQIPKNLFQAVAEVLAYVYRLKGTAGSWNSQKQGERSDRA